MDPHGPVCLIVEDTRFDQSMMTRVLAHLHPAPRVIMATTLAEARRHLGGADIDILFLDNMLPDGTGTEFLRELATHPTWARVPVVLVSDWPTPFMFDKARAAHVRAIWSKGDFTGERVRRMVRTHARVH
ncbi:response regulator [Pseudooceanicola sp. LIPI14-2-Ac024]|uniref:response regulator n=1 Tax=Pseudooceanicola sp. LIPI14-2-Ac024 TaxID=3344875 RepID=UPI0035CEDE34